ncbi:F-box domain-containing protein [Colletotrichum tofieldiae]|nr:F-box domain-containing protein [Colletotrichum tofieldiae]
MSLPCLISLPAKVLDSISRALPSEDLFALRQTCRCVAEKTSWTFHRRFFHTRYVMLEKQSLLNLIAISRHSVLRQAVQAVELCVDHLIKPEYYIDREELRHCRVYDDYNVIQRYKEEPMLEGDDGWESVRRGGYIEAWHNQAEFFREKPHHSLLAEAFSNLTNCRRVGVQDTTRPWGAFRLGRRIGTLPSQFVSQSLPNSITHALVVIRTLFYAAVQSRHPIEEIYIEFGELMTGCTAATPRMLSLPAMLAQAVRAWLQTVTRLSLIVNPTPGANDLTPSVRRRLPHTDPARTEASHWSAELLGFIGLFSTLSDLSLSFYPRDGGRQFQTLSKRLHIPTLRSLRLEYLDCGPRELTTLLERHKTTLRAVRLKSVCFTKGYTTSWSTLTERIQQNTLVETFSIEKCFVDDLEGKRIITLLDLLFAETRQDLCSLVAAIRQAEDESSEG